jgi:DNA-binding PadR family transcriptional regulator
MTLYSITPKGKRLLSGWLGFLSAIQNDKWIINFSNYKDIGIFKNSINSSNS